jgi:predicted dinucleotide-binding enzyme
VSRIAIIGAGRVGSALGRALRGAGHEVVFGVREVDRASGSPLPVTTDADAIAEADVVINATAGEHSVARFAPLAGLLRGTVVWDLANATARDPQGRPAGLLYPAGSLAEELQATLPGARVVKALNTMLHPVMTDPGGLSQPPTAFLSGADPAAKGTVTALLLDLGWRPEWIEDIGGLHTARVMEAFMLVVPALAGNHPGRPFALAVAV